MMFEAKEVLTFKSGYASPDGKSNWQSQYHVMAHYAASSKYKSRTLLQTRNKRATIYQNKAYADAALICVIDRKKEKLLMRTKVWRLSNVGSSLSWALERAFDHYKTIEVPHFKRGDIEMQLRLDYARCMKNLNREAWEAWSDLTRDFEGYKSFCEYKGEEPDAKVVEDIDALIALREKKKQQRRELDERRKAVREEQRKEDYDKVIAAIKEKVNSIIGDLPDTLTPSQKTRRLLDVTFTGDSITNLCPDSNMRRELFNYDYSTHLYLLDLRMSRLQSLTGQRFIDNTSGSRLCDSVWYDVENDKFVTSQGCEAEVKGICNRILDGIIEAADAGDHEKMGTLMNRSVGPYETRDYDWRSRVLRVGCHCFSLEDLKGLQAEYYGKSNERDDFTVKRYNKLIEEDRVKMVKLQMEIAKFNAKIKLLTTKK